MNSFQINEWINQMEFPLRLNPIYISPLPELQFIPKKKPNTNLKVYIISFSNLQKQNF